MNQSLANIFDETAEALSTLDEVKLHALEQRIVALAETNVKLERSEIGPLVQKQRQLEIILQNCQTNLDALTRLHARNMRKQWAQ